MDQPELGASCDASVARHIDRIMTAEQRGINLRVSEKSSAISLVSEPPDRATLTGLELLAPEDRAGIGEIGNRVKTRDGEAGEPVYDDPFRNGLASRLDRDKRQNGKKQQARRPPLFSLLPP